MFRVSQRGEGIDNADTIEGAREIVRGRRPARHDVHPLSRLVALGRPA